MTNKTDDAFVYTFFDLSKKNNLGREIAKKLLETASISQLEKITQQLLQHKSKDELRSMCLGFLDINSPHPLRGRGAEELFYERIDELDLSVRSSNCLKDGDIYYIGEVIQMSYEKILEPPNLGSVSTKEIESKISSIGLSLGTKIPNWTKPV